MSNEDEIRDHSASDAAYMSREERRLDALKRQSAHAESQVKSFLKEALKDDFIHNKLAQELRNVQNTPQDPNKLSRYASGGFSRDEHVTGFEPKLWERE